MTDRVEEIQEREVDEILAVTLERISTWLQAHGSPASEEYVDALDRLFNEQQSEIQRLRKVEEAGRHLARFIRERADVIEVGWPELTVLIDEALSLSKDGSTP